MAECGFQANPSEWSRLQAQYMRQISGMTIADGELLLPVAKEAAESATRLSDYLDSKGNASLTAGIAILGAFAAIGQMGDLGGTGYARVAIACGIFAIALSVVFAIWANWIRGDWYSSDPKAFFQPGFVGRSDTRDLREHLTLCYSEVFERNAKRADQKALWVSLSQASLGLGTGLLAISTLL